MLEIAAAVFVDILGQALFDVVFGLFGRSLKETVRKPGGTRDVEGILQSVIGFAIAGTGAGLVSLWVVPTRLTPPGPFPGVSLLVSPLLAGAVLFLLGRLTAARGVTGFALARFWYGVALTLPIALLRFLLSV